MEVNLMCESTIIIENDDGREEIMKDVIKVHVDGNSVTCVDITGNRQELTDVKVLEIDSLKHEIILGKN
jgi:predicted RNA-binding protein